MWCGCFVLNFSFLFLSMCIYCVFYCCWCIKCFVMLLLKREIKSNKTNWTYRFSWFIFGCLCDVSMCVCSLCYAQRIRRVCVCVFIWFFCRVRIKFCVFCFVFFFCFTIVFKIVNWPVMWLYFLFARLIAFLYFRYDFTLLLVYTWSWCLMLTIFIWVFVCVCV